MILLGWVVFCIFWKFTYFSLRTEIFYRESRVRHYSTTFRGRRKVWRQSLNTRHPARSLKFPIFRSPQNWEMLGRWCVVQDCSNSSTNQAGLLLHNSPVNKSAAVKCGLTWNPLWVMADENIEISELESDIFALCHSFICRGNDH